MFSMDATDASRMPVGVRSGTSGAGKRDVAGVRQAWGELPRGNSNMLIIRTLVAVVISSCDGRCEARRGYLDDVDGCTTVYVRDGNNNFSNTWWAPEECLYLLYAG